VQIKASTVNGDNELPNESNIRPPLLKADSDAIVEIGIVNTSWATFARIGYFGALTFHQSKILKSWVAASHRSDKYRSTSDLPSKSFSSWCWENTFKNFTS
jgi:hypothetical protein